MRTHENLNWVVNQITQFRSRGESVLVVFDLDSTLFDVTPRIQRILQLFREDPEALRRHSDHLHFVEKMNWQPMDWFIDAPLARAGWQASSSPELPADLAAFWKQHFFANGLLHLDEPYPGAAAFVRELVALEAEVVYLTGRDIPRMWEGSVASLKQHGFPLVSPERSLVLKPDSRLEDALFKAEWLGQQKSKYQRMFLFENEPFNIVKVEEDHPEIEIIFFASTHSGKLPADPTWRTISHFEIRSLIKKSDKGGSGC